MVDSNMATLLESTQTGSVAYTLCSPNNVIEVEMGKVCLRVFSVNRFKTVTRRILFESDMTMIRAVLALSSLLLAVVLYLQGDLAKLPQWQTTLHIASADVWATAFLLHFIGLSWRMVDPIPRVSCALFVNSFGLMIWVANTLAINVSTWKVYGTISPSTALETVVCLFAGWALFRTGQGKELLNP